MPPYQQLPGENKPEQTPSIDQLISQEYVSEARYDPYAQQGGVKGLWYKFKNNRKAPFVFISLVLLLLGTVLVFALGGNREKVATEAPLSDENYGYLEGQTEEVENAASGSDSSSGTDVFFESDPEDSSLEQDADPNAPRFSQNDLAGRPGIKAPDTPTEISASVNRSVVALSWKPVPDATQYRIELAITSAFVEPRTVVSGTNRAVISGLSANTTYYYRVKTVSPYATSLWSLSQQFRTDNFASPTDQSIGAVTNLQIVSTVSNGVRLTWTAATNAQRYVIFRSTDSTLKTNVREYAATSSTSYTVSDLLSGTKYYFAVQPIGAASSGPRSAIVTATTSITEPEIVAIRAISPTELEVRWRSQTGATKYEVRYSKSATLSGARVAETTKNIVSIGSLDDNSVYYIQVRAYDGQRWTAWSGAESHRTPRAAAPDPPPSNANGPAFRIATFNVLGDHHTDPGGKDSSWPDGPSRFAEAMQVIRSNDLDVVGLQEFEPPQRDKFNAIAGDNWGIHPNEVVSGKFYSVNPIIWKKARFELVDKGRLEGRDYFNGSEQWVAWVKLRDRSSKKIFYVANVHDPANTSYAPNQGRYRFSNAEKHVRDMLNRVDNGVPSFYVGDFNSAFQLRPADSAFNGDRSKLTYCVMTDDRRIQNAYDAARDRRGKCPTRSILGNIDHVYVSTNLVEVKRWATIGGLRERQISDHPVVYANVVVR